MGQILAWIFLGVIVFNGIALFFAVGTWVSSDDYITYSKALRITYFYLIISVLSTIIFLGIIAGLTWVFHVIYQTDIVF